MSPLRAPLPSFLVTAALGAFFVFAGSIRAVEIDVYILTGQSNSLGTTGLESDAHPGVDPADAATDFFWSNVSSTNTVYPPTLYGDSGGAVTTLQTQQGDGGVNQSFWGPEFGLARRLYAAGQRELIVIKASRGGGGNTLWEKTAFDANSDSGHMWGQLRDTIDSALAAVGNSDTFQVRGLAYLQGESNSGPEAALADIRMRDLIENLRTHINDSFPGAADSMHAVIGEIAASGSTTNRIQTTQLHQALASDDANVSFVPTSDLPLKSDGIHFGRDAKLTIGERFADAFIAVSEQPNGVLGDVNQDGVVSAGGGDPMTDDVAAMIAGWRADTTGLTNLARTQMGDLDLSGQTDLADVFILHHALELQGEAFPFDALAAAPEPSGWVPVAWCVYLAVAFRGGNPPGSRRAHAESVS